MSFADDLRELQHWLRSAAEQLEALRVRLLGAQESVERGDLERADQALSEVLRFKPEDVEAQRLQLWLKSAGEDLQRECRRSAERAESFLAWLSAAHEALQMGDLQRAANALSEALRLNPEDTGVLQLLDWLSLAGRELQHRLRSSADQLEASRVRLLGAQEALERGDLERAAHALSEVLRFKPEDFEALQLQQWLKSFVEKLQREIDTAVGRTEEFLARLVAAHEALQMGGLKPAANALDEALRLNPEDTEVLKLRNRLRSIGGGLHNRLRSVAEQLDASRVRLLGAQEALGSGDPPRAARALNELTDLIPRGTMVLRLAQRVKAAAARGAPVRFHTLWQRAMYRQEWRPLLVYLYGGLGGLEGARADFRRRSDARLRQFRDSMTSAVLEQGAAVTIVPEAAGFAFNPPAAIVHWLEDWHCVEFRMRAEHSSELELPATVSGRVSFFVGPLLIAENEIVLKVLPGAPTGNSSAANSDDEDLLCAFSDETGAAPYRAIFVSYSHEDDLIVDQLEKAYRALGDSYLRDINILRSGEFWSPGVLSAIPQADVFQLCWSNAARQSTSVEQEWRCALGLDRPYFIRPVFWHRPMPEPPHELGHLHFTFIEMS